MLIGNGSRLASNPMRTMGGVQYLNDINVPRIVAGATRNKSVAFGRLASIPGGAQPPEAWVRAVEGGDMSTYGAIEGSATLTGYATKGVNLLAPGISGAGTISSADMGVIIQLLTNIADNVGTLEGSIAMSLSMAADLSGSGDLEGALGLIAWIVADLIGAGDMATSTLRGDVYMGASIDSAGSVVTAASCAKAVWEALASAYSSGATMGQALAEIYRIQGLDASAPMTVTPTSRTAGAITQVISGDGLTTTTVERT